MAKKGSQSPLHSIYFRWSVKYSLDLLGEAQHELSVLQQQT